MESISTEGTKITANLVGTALPKALTTRQLCRAFGVSYRTFYRHQNEYAPFLLPRPIGRKRYSGERVQQFLNGRGRPAEAGQ